MDDLEKGNFNRRISSYTDFPPRIEIQHYFFCRACKPNLNLQTWGENDAAERSLAMEGKKSRDFR